MRWFAARDPRQGKHGEVNMGNETRRLLRRAIRAVAMHFGVAKTGVVALELEIVRCVLAPPERVCLEIMS
jgi:hypothetical protein